MSGASMEATLPLLRGRISLSDALQEDKDILQELSYPEKRLDFYLRLYQCRPEIEEVISRHLNLARSDFKLGGAEEWIHGSFNVCLPVYINANARRWRLPTRAIIRFPLPYKIGEESYPGNVEEKLRCEAGTYIWLHNHCPDVPVPQLLGFGLPSGRTVGGSDPDCCPALQRLLILVSDVQFTSLENASTFSRLTWHLRYGIAWLFRWPTPFAYTPQRRQNLLDLGYLIIEYVDQGRMLSESWGKHQSDPDRRANLFRGLSKLMLGIMKSPLPRIGSWSIQDSGMLSLTNRPLTLGLLQQENLGIPTEIPRHMTYSIAEPYYLDLMGRHDNILRYQPNSIHDEEDGRMQMAALTIIRALLPRFTNREFREGPFYIDLTDLHPSNIFVDDDWNITRIIDLEWTCARPVEMISPPSWIYGHNLDDMAGHMEKCSALHREFTTVFEEEELARYRSTERTLMLRANWETGAFWYFQALDHPVVLPGVLHKHIQPRFDEVGTTSPDDFDRILAPYWDRGTTRFIAAKLKEHEQYSLKLHELFRGATVKSHP